MHEIDEYVEGGLVGPLRVIQHKEHLLRIRELNELAHDGIAQLTSVRLGPDPCLEAPQHTHSCGGCITRFRVGLGSLVGGREQSGHEARLKRLQRVALVLEASTDNHRHRTVASHSR